MSGGNAKTTLVIVEGKGDRDFLEFLYREWFGKDKNIEFRACGGKYRMKKAFKKREGENKLEPVLQGNILDREGMTLKIIFDADNDLEKSKENIRKQLEELKVDPRKTEIFLLPNDEDKGNLETLIENVATIKEVIGCFKIYRECIESIKESDRYQDKVTIQSPGSKEMIYAYFLSLSCIEKPEDKTSCKEGILGGKTYLHNKDIIDTESDYLKPLKTFLNPDSINQ